MNVKNNKYTLVNMNDLKLGNETLCFENQSRLTLFLPNISIYEVSTNHWKIIQHKRKYITHHTIEQQYLWFYYNIG